MPDDLRQAFISEARELSEQLMLGVLHAERQRTVTQDERRHLLRLAHTLKGAARVVKEQAIGDAAHAIEDLITSAADRLEPAIVTRLLALIDDISGSLPQPEDAHGRSAGGPAQIPEDTRALRVEPADVSAIIEHVADLATQMASLQIELASASPQARAAGDRLALSIAELRTELHRMRLAPAGNVFPAVERTVRDAAHASDVLVSFSASGGEHRLDADVLDALRDALIQLARNAVAHGIESPRERAGAGKPHEGQITLLVERRGSAVAFSVTDDGRGLDVGALRRAAVARGHDRHLPEPALINLLLAGGLTSRPEASQIAGRGVGLDLVRSIVARLHGEVTLRHEPRRGVTVEIVVPASMRSLQYVRIESGRCAALLPLDVVRGTVRLAESPRVVLDGRTHLMIGDRPTPMVTLEQVLAADAEDAPTVAALVSTSTGEVAVAAVRFGEAAQTIAQALPPLTGAAAIVRDIAIDPDGRIVPVLEARLLTAAMADTSRAGPQKEKTPLVLVVDDSVTSRMLEQSILEGAGFRVDTAASAEDALACAMETDYELFIVDVEMPGMNGFEFVQATRADERLARTPAILVTSRGTQADRQRGTDAGARGYIVKSEFDQDTFLDLVRRLVE